MQNLRHLPLLLAFLLSAKPSLSIVIHCNFTRVAFTTERLYSCDGSDSYGDGQHQVITAVNDSQPATAEVKGVRLSDCRIAQISARSFRNLAALTELDLSYNRIAFVHENLLADFEKLKFLFLNNNRVAFVGPNLLQPLKSLTYTDLSSNLCVSLKFFDSQSEGSAAELRNFVIDLAIQCPLTLDIAAQYFGILGEKTDEKLQFYENFGKNGGSLRQEKLKREIFRRIYGGKNFH